MRTDINGREKKYGQEISSPTKLLEYTNPIELIKYLETKALRWNY
jgi:hypothetical protein